MAKRRILFVSDSPTLYTGYANIARHVAEYLHNTGDYEVGFLGWFHNDKNKIEVPYTLYTTLMRHGKCCGRGDVIQKRVGNGAWEYHILSKEVPFMYKLKDQKDCHVIYALDFDKYGQRSLPAICNDFKPDIVWGLGDFWMQAHLFRKMKVNGKTRENIIRDNARVVSYMPIDGDPMPSLTKLGQVEMNWVDGLLDADKCVAYCNWGKDVINETTRKVTDREACQDFIHHGCDIDTYKPLNDKERLKIRLIRYGVRNEFLIGTFSRNQPRKNFPLLIKSIAEFKKQGLEDPERPIKLYIHAPVEDCGWDLQGLITENNAQEWVQLNETLKVSSGVTEEELNELYNGLDCHMLLSSGEGWGLCLEESMAAGIPTISVDYSAHSDWGRLDGKPGMMFVPPTARTQEPITNIGRAQSTPEEVIKVLKKVYDGAAEVQETVEVGRKIAERDSWKNVLPKWKELLDSVDISGNKAYEEPPVEKKPIYISDMVDPNDKMRILFTMPESAGDVLLATGVVKALQKKYPFGQIYWAINNKFKDILDGFKDIKVIPYDDYLLQYNEMHKYFSLVYTPHFWTQKYANWVKAGTGLHLIDTYAQACDVEAEDPWIRVDRLHGETYRGEYITVHTSAAKDQWHIRNFPRWNDVIDIIKSERPAVKVFQVGSSEDIKINSDIDLRGKTTPQTLAYIIKGAKVHLGIDSFPAHLASTVGTRSVITFPNTWPHLTGPKKGCTPIMPEQRLPGCNKPCHMLTCKVKPGDTCAKYISVRLVANEVLNILEFE